VLEERYIDAIRLFETALDIDPDHKPCLRGSAALHEKTNDPRSAKFFYQKLTSSESPAPSDFLGLARVSSALSDDVNALTALQSAASLFPDHHEIQYRLGVLYRDCSQFHEAAACFRKAIQIDKQKRNAFHALGNIEFELQNYDEARRNLEFYLEKNPSDFQSNMRVAYIHFQNGSFDRALPFYRQAVESNSASIDARVGLASTLEKLGRPQAAIRTYNDVINSADDVSSLEPVILALVNLLNRQHEFDRTISLLQGLSPKVSNSPGLSCALGIALAGEGNYAEAVVAFERSVGHPRWGSFATSQINKIKKLKSYDTGK
jgi:tetratricopeptide (TPR) repeat protein